MSADERPAPATGTGLSEIVAAKLGLAPDPSRSLGSPASPTLARLSAALRDYGLARADENIDRWWRSCADAAIAHLAAGDRPFSADQVAALVPNPDHPCRWGARFSAALKAGVIRPVGYTVSARPSRHRGVQRLYVGGEA